PDLDAYHRNNLITYAVLLLVPAINLSSMTHSRLSRRAREIGVRRAFGATRFEIMTDLFMENLIITIVAGLIGWLLSVVFAMMFVDVFFTSTYGASSVTGLTVGSLLRPRTFGWAMLFCFILNLLSAALPAWQASRTNIVNALSGKK
ncbi:MAG: FtsX-like permease family protein, partial [Duncaniella sp.]|nr:FtsX-like permease family protein [Duncaniella sp.]